MNGYNGIDHTNNNFNVLVVSLQTIFSNWLGPVWWSLASLRMLLAWLEVNDGQTALNAYSDFHGVIQTKRHSSSNSNTQVNKGDTGLDDLNLSLVNDEPTLSRFHHRRPFFEYLTLQTIFTVSSTLAVMLACVWLRDDPVLWRVLAPKYVNVALWAIFHHFMINIVLCTGLWTAIAR